jgi:hypothetical protein
VDNSNSILDDAVGNEAFSESALVATANSNQQNADDRFRPRRPKSLADTSLQMADLYPLTLKYLFLHGNRSGNQIAKQLKLPYEFIIPVMESLKADLLVAHKTSAGIGDYQFELTPKGVEQARLHLARSTYCGSAPVSIEDYEDSVRRQSIRNLAPSFEDVSKALSDLVVTDLTINQMGQAINSRQRKNKLGQTSHSRDQRSPLDSSRDHDRRRSHPHV